MSGSENPFDTLPNDVINILENYLPDSDKSRVDSTCKRFYENGLNDTLFSLFSHPNNTRMYLVSKQVQELLRYIHRSELSKVEIMLERDPGLLLEKGKVRVYAGSDTTFEELTLTPLELAYRERNPDMCRLIKRCYEQLPKERKEEIPNQIKKFSETPTYDLSAVIAAISSFKNVDGALRKFRKDLDALVKNKGFPIQAFVAAYDIYGKNDELWSAAQCILYSVYIIGYLQRLAPGWIKKIIANGIYDVVVEGKECQDSFDLVDSGSIDPDAGLPNSGFGFDSVVNILGEQKELRKWLARAGNASWAVPGLGKFFRTKAAEINELKLQESCSSQAGPARSRCMII